MTQKQNAPASRQANESAFQPPKSSADSTRITPAKPIRFTPRELRAIHTLQTRESVERVELDSILHSTNCADTIMRLRRKLGQDAIETELHSVTNIYGEKSQAGRYRLTPAGHAIIAKMGGL